MSISFYDASVATYLQTMQAVAGFLEVGANYCSERNISLDDIVESRIYPDMLPFRYQIQSVSHHALGSMNAFVNGTFSPSVDLPDANYSELQQLIGDAIDTLKTYSAEIVDTYAEREVMFVFGKHKMPFIASNFLLSFSLPNFYFHATTAYDILRGKGAPVGKAHYLGPLRMSK